MTNLPSTERILNTVIFRKNYFIILSYYFISTCMFWICVETHYNYKARERKGNGIFNLKKQLTSGTTQWGLYFNNHQLKSNFGNPGKLYCILTFLGDPQSELRSSQFSNSKGIHFYLCGEGKTTFEDK